MNRRTYLVALAPLVTGCFGSRPNQSSATETPERTETPTATPEPTPTATPESTASEAAARHIGDARTRLNEAVYVYTGGVSNDLTSVTAEAESFRAREVLLRLDGLQRSLADASTAAPSEDQRATIDALDSMQRFLTLATDAQSWLIDGHDALTAAYAHMDSGDLGAAEDALGRAETAVDEVSPPTTTIQEELDAANASVVDAVDEDEYGAKVTQLADEADALDSLVDAADDVRNGISMVRRARTEVDEGRTDRAADTADRAYEVLSDVDNRLGDLLDDFPEPAAAFEGVAEDVRYLASRHADDAEAIYERHA